MDNLVKDSSSRKKRNHVRLKHIGTHQSPTRASRTQARSDESYETPKEHRFRRTSTRSPQ